MNVQSWFYDERSYHKYLCIDAEEDEMPLVVAALTAADVVLGGQGPCRRPASNGVLYRHWLRIVSAKPAGVPVNDLIARALDRWSAPSLELLPPAPEPHSSEPTVERLIRDLGEGLLGIESAIERAASPNLWTTAIDHRLVGIERAMQGLAVAVAGSGNDPLAETLRQLDKIRDDCSVWEDLAKQNESRAIQAEAAQREAQIALTAKIVEVEDLRRAQRYGAERPSRGADRLEQMVEAAFPTLRFEEGSLDVLLGEFYDPSPTMRELGKVCADPTVPSRWQTVQRAKPWREGPHLQTGNGADGRVYALQTKPGEFRVLVGQKVDQERDFDRMARHRS